MIKCVNIINIFVMFNIIINCTAGKRRQYDGVSEENTDFDTSRYKFAYGVEDHKTGDFKMHQEERDGDLVKGEYTVAEADGTLRTVRYTADKLNGFHAVISKAGDARQEFLPAPAALTSSPSASSTYHHPIKVAQKHYNQRREQEHQDDASQHHTQTTTTQVQHIPIKKYIHDLPQFAKQYAVKHNKIIESFAADNAAHYQSVNIDNNDETTHYSYNLSQDKLREQRIKDENAKQQKFHANHFNSNKHLEVYGQPVVFHLQTPQGFKKNVDVDMPVALPLVSHPGHPVHEDVNEESPNQHQQYQHDLEREKEKERLEREQERHRIANLHSVEEPEWKQYDPQGRNDRQINNYKQVFEAHFGKFRRPSKENQGAYSYMNYEGETRNGYELQHNHNNNHQNSIQRKQF